MQKQLRFSPKLVPLVLDGEKTTTWRLWDDKDLQTGDTVEFLNAETDEPFATAQLVGVYEKPMGECDASDASNPDFEVDDEMYKNYTRWYDREVTPKTIVKVCHFKVTEER